MVDRHLRGGNPFGNVTISAVSHVSFIHKVTAAAAGRNESPACKPLLLASWFRGSRTYLGEVRALLVSPSMTSSHLHLLRFSVESFLRAAEVGGVPCTR